MLMERREDDRVAEDEIRCRSHHGVEQELPRNLGRVVRRRHADASRYVGRRHGGLEVVLGLDFLLVTCRVKTHARIATVRPRIRTGFSATKRRIELVGARKMADCCSLSADRSRGEGAPLESGAVA